MKPSGRRIRISGVVQGVGFRPWVYRLASATGVAGRVRNDTAGVTIEAFGSPAAIDHFMDRLVATPPPAACIVDIRSETIPAEDATGFVIAGSDPDGAPRVTIPPDLATCPACTRDILDAADRRYRYPFTNCTNCGPRFTIVREVPYDRPNTTMAPFRMCRECEAEYRSVENRRFHAEPNACPQCGPRLRPISPDGRPLDWPDPVAGAAAAIAGGAIVAVKGIGGFHLACDGTSDATVQRLRHRKRRDEKPFAVMVANLAEAERVAHLDARERDLLTSVERPIVLVRRRASSGLAPAVAPGNPLVGLLLPYSPLHHLLLEDAGRPLVMTSANLSDEPLVYRNAEALARLGGLADALLVHDREIETRCDDSIARVIAGRPTVLRRSRGYVPRPFHVARSFELPVLGVGAHLKNTFCLGTAGTAYLGPHIGDLENLETYRSYCDAIDRLERFVKVAPEAIGHDLHPDYLSTSYALARPGVRTVAVQHHHAHVASLMTEHGLEGPVLGVAYDGTGYGLDGTAWGGEMLLARYRDFEWLATFRPIPLAGGDRAIRQVWRVALAVVDDAFDGDGPVDRLPLFESVPESDVQTVRRMIARRLNTPLARGVGRVFDALGALALGRTESRYEGQAALEANLAADPDERTAYPVDVDRNAVPWVIDLRPAWRELVVDLLHGAAPGIVSARLHNTLVRVTADVVRDLSAAHGLRSVALTGGCFQNARLAEGLVDVLGATHDLFLHGHVPPGDGGIALGQAVVASARVAAGE